ncbi:hypothetical protein THAOC_01812 [Thalassiosira oceanica]|uniref:MYND-type domain-containing protein n=1 Tax=Thalassiosira oceanica TaxID=159749 RepID=K0THD5_THAOC|nr:hypothetical protein THAOC_01812 [Thalassiosira oceanica]|eukprot:EJK76424.1 hypothetical protein THAOC_01812 [Thalassiosira oceanica]
MMASKPPAQTAASSKGERHHQIEEVNFTACLPSRQVVKYCGADCQRAHRKLHKKVCKQRTAELKDESSCTNDADTLAMAIVQAQGRVWSRHNLGNLEGREENYDRAVRHFLISAKMGDETSVEVIDQENVHELACNECPKEQYADALNETRLPRRRGGNEEKEES